MTDKEVSKELSSISTLNGWGILGIIIPIVGFICGGIAHSRANKLLVFMSEEQKGKYRGIIHKRKVASVILILLSVVSAAIMVIASINSVRYEAEKRAAEGNSTRIEQLQRQEEAAKVEANKAEALSVCLENAYTAYKKDWDSSAESYGTGGKLPLDQAEFLDRRHEDAKNDCHNQND